MSQGRAKQRKSGVTTGENLTFSSESEISEPACQVKKRQLRSRSVGKKTLESNHTFSSESEVSNSVTREDLANKQKRSRWSGGKKTLESNHTFSSESEVSNSVTREDLANKQKRSRWSGGKKTLQTNHTFSSESEVSNSVTSEDLPKKRKRSSRSGEKKTLETNQTFSSESEVSNSVKTKGRGNNKKRSSKSGNKLNDTPSHTTVYCTIPGCFSKSAFSNKFSLQVHVRLNHKHFKCGGCSKIYNIRHFNNVHLKNNPTCAEVNPQPWDDENKKEAEWILTRHDRDGKTTYGCKPGFFKNREFQCNYPECSLSFSDKRSAQSHMTRIHRLVKCVECSLITTLGNFIPTHLKKKLTCGNTTPIPWITNEKDADWYVSRKYIDGKTVFWIERPCIANQRPSQGENFQCKYKGCQRYYATKLTLDKHIRNTHRNFRCGVCAGIFSSRQFNSHLKKSPECAQMDPQPCDIENHKEADWTIIREVKYGKTTFRFIPATNTNREFQCNYPECSLSFSDKKSAQSHMTRIHRLVKCVECSLITTLRNFIPTHLKKKLTCGNTTPIPWFKKNVNDSDWYVSRKYIDEKTVFSIQSLANRRPNQERNFQCKYKGCQRCYATKKKLDEHLGYAHKHFKCSVCARIYNRFRFNRHLKKSPECAQMDPQPWDIENQKEAEWTFIRKGKDGKTTLHLITRKRKSQCNFEGCTMSFPGRAQYLLHIQHHQKHFRCSRCSEIHSIEKFNTEHLKKNPKCGKKKPQPWDKKNEKEADWLVIRMRFNGKTRFSYRRLANPGKGPESDTDSDENITFGTESNVYINHSRKPQRTTWLSKYVERNALTNMTCEVFGCSYHTTHAVLLRHHYKTNHSSLMRNWSVSFDAASQDMHCCSTRKCRFQTNSDQLFESHNKRHIKLFAFQCFLCHQLYQYKNSLTEHLMETHKIFRNPNKFVVYIYDQKSKPKRRMEGTNLYCSICNRQIQTARFKNHLRRMHPPKIPLQHCNFCNPNQNSIGSDELRDKTMDLKCSFKTCGFETLTFQDFRQHSLSHQYFKSQILAHETDIRSTANVSFECPRNNCKFHTSSQYVLNRHENNHRHGLSARCLLCYDIFRTTDKFLNHVATRHKIHVNRLALYDDCNEDNGIVKLYQCNLEHCTGFVTLIKSIYEEHLFHHVSHTSDTFRCGLCSLPLTTARELISHFERSHSSADLTLKNSKVTTTFSCDLCNLIFKSSMVLIIHNQTHHPKHVTSVVDEVYPDFYKKSRRFKTFSTSAEGEV